MPEISATKSAAMALADERGLMRQGYGFLDEKRVLLAGRMLRELARHETLEHRLRGALHAAGSALGAALERHGLAGLQAYPAPQEQAPLLQETPTRFLGVVQLDVACHAQTRPGRDDALDASSEARHCAVAFAALLPMLAELAACRGNVERLAQAYRRTERRARALENVLLPEIERSLALIENRLELADQEEALRTRLAGH